MAFLFVLQEVLQLNMPCVSVEILLAGIRLSICVVVR